MTQTEKLIEVMAKMECNRENPMMSDAKDHSFWEEKASDSYKTIYRNVAKQLLEACKEAGLKFVPGAFGLILNKDTRYSSYEAGIVAQVESQIEEIKI